MTRLARSVLLFGALGLAACGAPDPSADFDSSTSLYALVETSPGVYLYPPLAPEPRVTGTFDDTLLDQLEVALEATDAGGSVSTLAIFDSGSSPALVLLGAHELYFVNVPAADYFTDPSLSYRFRVFQAGEQIAQSDMTPHVFTVLSYVPALKVGVKIRIEQSAHTMFFASQGSIDWPIHAVERYDGDRFTRWPGVVFTDSLRYLTNGVWTTLDNPGIWNLREDWGPSDGTLLPAIAPWVPATATDAVLTIEATLADGTHASTHIDYTR